MTAELETIVFKDVNAFGLSRQVWDWQCQNPVEIIKTHPDELLEMNMRAPSPQHAKIVAAHNTISRRIEFRKR